MKRIFYYSAQKSAPQSKYKAYFCVLMKFSHSTGSGTFAYSEIEGA